MPEVSNKKFSRKQKDKIIGEFMDDFDLSFTAESRNRIDQVDDLRFAALDQWPDDVKLERKNRPMLTLDHIGQPIRKILGGIRQNMPSIKVDPIDDGADPDTADVLEDLVRQIEQSSNARNAYIKGASFQVKMGYGVWRVNTKINENDIFDQDIVILPVKNPFTYYFDPDAIEPQKQDGRFMIVSETLSKEKFEATFDIKVPASIPNQGIGETLERWYDSDSVRIGEYFVKSKKKRKITQLSNGVVVNSDEITDEDIALYEQQGITPAKEKEVETNVIDWYKLTAFEILEHIEWPSKFFPGIPVYGEEENIEGETNYRGIVRPAKDPQRMYNYWNSAAAETIALQPKAPFIATNDQIKNNKQAWLRANIDNLSVLTYESDPKAPGPPQRVAPPIMQSGLLQQAAISANDIQQATGVFEASTGALPEQRSGRAVIALQQEADLGTSLFQDNLAVAIQHTGKVILDLIPKYYDTERIIRIRGEDDAVRFIEINKPILTPDGLRIQNDLTRGKYDVRVAVGPSFRTRRIEAASSMVELARVFPQILQVAGDLVAKNLDWPGAEELAERLKKILPPGIVDDEEDQDPQKLAQQQQAIQLQQQAVQLELADKQVDIEAKQAVAAKNKAAAVKTMSDVENQSLELQGDQAVIAKDRATAMKTITEVQKIELENAVQIAELAAQQQNQRLLNQALSDITNLIRNEAPRQVTVGLAAG